VDDEASPQSLPGHAARVARVAGSFQTMDHYQFAPRGPVWVLGVYQDFHGGLGVVINGLRRPALVDRGAGPEVPRYGGEMRITKEGNVGGQEIYSNRAARSNLDESRSVVPACTTSGFS
jgi:hypothetical protein